MANPEEQAFPPRIVSQALGIPAGTLSTWANRGWMANFDAEFAEGRGRRRMFSLSDVLALALIKFASDHGSTQSEIIGYAPEAARSYLEHPSHITHLFVRWYRTPSLCSIRYNDDIMKEPAPPNPEYLVSFDLRVIFGDAKRAIEAALASANVEQETRIEEMNPTLPKISRILRQG